MNLKTTILLAVLVAVGAVVWFLVPTGPRDDRGPTEEFLEKQLTAEDLTRIEIKHGDKSVVLERPDAKSAWSLPGKWPVRTPELTALLDTLTNLRSRFASEPLGDKPELKKYGLSGTPLVVNVSLKDKKHTLTFGEEQTDTNSFSRPTFVRLDDKNEVLRLAPGLIATLDRPQDYYQQRRLFEPERVAREGDPTEKVEQVAAKAISVKSPDGTFEIVKKGNDWEITSPVKDHVDPDKLKTILGAIPDIWVEQFKTKKLEDTGLKDPETVVTVTKPSGETVKLLIGKESELKFRKVSKPSPPPQSPLMPPKQDFDMVPETYRYAKLADNDQVFEIKGDKLKDIGVSLSSLRDPQVARFKAADVKHLEVTQGKETLVFSRDKDGKWKFEKPKAEDAESGPINDLLDKLAGLRATDKDVLDKPDPKTVGLETPAATIKATVEEEKGDKDNKTKTTRDLVFQLGAKEKDKDNKLYVRVEGWERVNAVEDALLKLAQRPAYAYKSRKVLDIAAADIGKLEIKRGEGTYVFQQEKDKWKLTAPATADVDSFQVGKLAGDLGKLEVVETVTDTPKAEDLDKLYGLAKAALSAKLVPTDEKKPARTIAVGNARPGKDKEYFARVDDGPVVVVRKDVRDDLDRDSLEYLRRSLDMPKDKIREVAITKAGQEYRLVHDGKTWSVRGPVDAPAVADAAEPVADALSSLRAERYVAHDAKDLGKYGLDKPYLTVRLIPSGKDETEQQLLIGDTVPKDKKADEKSDKGKDHADKDRYAKLGKGGAIFVVSDRTVAALDHAALDFLDKKLVSLPIGSIKKVQSAGATPFTLEQKKDEWEVTGSPAPAFKADEDAALSVLRPWTNLRAERIAAYGPKIDWAAFGLDKPGQVVTVFAEEEAKKPADKAADEGDDKKKDKEPKDKGKEPDKAKDKEKEPARTLTQHQLALGKETDKGMRFARLDKQDQVVVLDGLTVAALASTHLDFLDPRVLKFDLDTVNSISRQMSPGGDLELVKREDNWRFLKPADKAADDPTVGDVLEKTFRLRVQKIAAYPAKDLAPYGLDKPAAVVTLKLTDFQGRKVEHTIKVGKKADDKKDERYAMIDKGEMVVVLGAELSNHLVAPVLHFADRNLPGFTSADKAMVERPGRKATFVRGETAWTMSEPVKAEAEDAELDELMKGLRRLRAEEVVADKGADLKPYGLDKPEAQWHFYSGDKEVLHLQIGSADKEGRRYAKLAGGTEVFTLSSKLSARVVEEFRNRKPWPSLDAAQVEKLTVTGPAPFTLTKKDGDWSLSTNASAKVDAKQVTDTLDALAGLKAQRYVVDAKADLKLYGLDPAVWTIEAQTPSGKKTLLVGRAEGDSKRMYATVPGSDAVFVIGEAEAQRILRAPAAFVNSKK